MTMVMHNAAITKTTAMVTRIWRFTSRSEVTRRSTPTTLPLYMRGAETARMFSPVSGSRPWKATQSCWAMACSMSGVPGLMPFFKLEVEETWMRPVPLMNCSSMRSLSSKLVVDWVARCKYSAKPLSIK